jgi:hypothetical protein
VNAGLSRHAGFRVARKCLEWRLSSESFWGQVVFALLVDFKGRIL